MKITHLFVAGLLLYLLAGCTADKLEPPVAEVCDVQPTYDSDVKEIIDRACAYVGCHNANPPGDYTVYNGDLITFLQFLIGWTVNSG